MCGSVNASNAAELFAQPDIDRALVGGASLKADAFAVIVKAAEAAKRGKSDRCRISYPAPSLTLRLNAKSHTDDPEFPRLKHG